MSEQQITDQAQVVRPGAELDVPRLTAYLHEALALQVDLPVSVEQVVFGFSNLTYRVYIGNLDLILRRPPVGAHVKSGHDMGREFRVLSALAPIYPYAPRPLAFCDDDSVIGAPFYVMERVEGVILRQPVPQGVELTPEVIHAVSASLIDNLVTIHSLDCSTGALSELGKPEGYAQRQVGGWIERYARAKTDDIPDLDRVAGWLSERIPAHTGAALIHNDYKYDNVILDRADLSQIRAVLDWEMSTLGDPLMDLGTTLAYWVDPDDPEHRSGGPLNDRLTSLPGNMRRAELAQRYAKRSGRDLGDIVFYFVFGLYKNAVIAQQIHARYVLGLLPDTRYGQFMPAIRSLGAVAVRAIEKNRIDQLG
ncbi:MAG TPA: phosphotransferase family protein [Ktedonobacterales bacterium]